MSSRLALVSALLSPAARAGVQSALDPAGADAARIGTLSAVMFIGAAAIFVLVMVLTVLAMRRTSWIAQRRTIVIGGIAFPIVVLTLLLVHGLRVMGAVDRGPGRDPLRIEVIGEQFWWRVHYLDGRGAVAFASANEIHIPMGRPVELVLRTADVIHSFWVPSLAGKLDMIPGRVNVLRLGAAQPGIYRGQCAEFCGAQHALMSFYVVAEAPERFAAWLAAEAQAARAPDAPMLARGQQLFFANDCQECHAIRGTAADGVRGPDLTHVGSRLSLGAGALPNNVGTLAGWIASSQHLKPDNLMPSFDQLPAQDLRALAAYLGSLE